MGEAGRPKRKPVILHVFPSFARGGQQMRLAQIVAGLAGAYGHRIISLDGAVSARQAFAPGTVEVETIRAVKSSGVSPSNIRYFRYLLEGADLLCTYNFGSIEAAIANRIGPQRPHIHFEDGFGPDESLSRQKIRRNLLRRLVLRKSVIVVPSRGLETLALKTWRLPRQNVRRIVNGVDFDRFAPVRRRMREQSPVIVGTIGALRAEKNYALLIRAFLKSGSRKAARLLIYGDGPEKERLSSLAERSGGAAVLCGETGAPETALAAFDIFVLSSDTEQAPMSLLEAMATGLPIAASDVGEIREMVCEENRQFVVPPGDEDSFAAALAWLIDDPSLRMRLGTANAEKARRDYSSARMIADYRRLFEEALGRMRQ